MAFLVTISGINVGTTTGPFEIREFSSSGSLLATGVSRVDLIAGYPVSASDGTDQIYVGSLGSCTGSFAKTAVDAPTPTPVPVPVPTAPSPVPQPVPAPASPTPVPAPASPTPVPQPVPAPASPTPVPVPAPASPTPVPQPVPVPAPAAVSCNEYELEGGPGESGTFSYTRCSDGATVTENIEDGDSAPVCSRDLPVLESGTGSITDNEQSCTSPTPVPVPAPAPVPVPAPAVSCESWEAYNAGCQTGEGYVTYTPCAGGSPQTINISCGDSATVPCAQAGTLSEGASINLSLNGSC